MFITIGTKLRAIKDVNSSIKKGDEYVVRKLHNNALLSFSPVNVTMITAIIDINFINEYFEVVEDKVKEEEKKEVKTPKWSEWQYRNPTYYTINGIPYEVPVKYRYSDRNIDLRTNYKDDEHKNIRIKTCCNPDDKFNLDKGLALADAKLALALMERTVKTMITDM